MLYNTRFIRYAINYHLSDMPSIMMSRWNVKCIKCCTQKPVFYFIWQVKKNAEIKFTHSKVAFKILFKITSIIFICAVLVIFICDDVINFFFSHICLNNGHQSSSTKQSSSSYCQLVSLLFAILFALDQARSGRWGTTESQSFYLNGSL